MPTPEATPPTEQIRTAARQMSDADRARVADSLIAALAPSVQRIGTVIADGASAAAAAAEGRDDVSVPAHAITLARAFLAQPALARELTNEWRGCVVQLGAARSAEAPAERLELAILAAERASALAQEVVALDPNAGRGGWLDNLRGALRDAGQFLGRVAEGAANAAEGFGVAVGTGAGVTLLVGALGLWWLFKSSK